MTAHDLPKAGLRWFPLNVGTALVLATVVSLLAFMLLSDGDGQAAAEQSPLAAVADSVAADAGPSSPIAAPAASATTVAPAESVTEHRAESRNLGGEDSAAMTSILGPDDGQALVTPVVVAMGASEFGSGPTEVALVTNFPAVEYEWERVALEGSGYFDLSWIGELNGSLVAVSSGWSEVGFEYEGGSQSLVTWSTSDGDWRQVGSLELPADTWITRVIGSDDRVYAIVEQAPEDGSSTSYMIMASADGVAWETEALPISRAEGSEYVYLQDAVVGPRGIALLIQSEDYPPEPPQRLIFDEYEVEINHESGQYTLLDAASGEVFLSGSIEDLYRWSELDGQRIADPATGEEITVVPWEVWERAYAGVYEGEYGGSPLPIPIEYGASYEHPVVTIEHDGYVITLDEAVGTFFVVDAATGDEVAQGPLEYIYQGPPPQLVDPETGDVVLSVTWDEWYQAEERAWETYGYSDVDYFYSSRTAVLTSDGAGAWSEQVMTEGSNGSSGFITATADGFTVVVTTYGDLGEQRTVWQMVDGDWSSTEVEQSQLWLYNIAHTDDGFYAIGDGSTGQAVWSSTDGLSWATEFTTAPQADGGYVWLSDVATDGNGLVGVIASHEPVYEYTPLVIEQERYAAVFEDGETVVHITDTQSGETVLLLTWQDFEFEAGATVVTREGETTVFALDNGDVMVISDLVANAAMETRYVDNAPDVSVSVFLKSGNSWAEAVVDPGGGFSGAWQLFMSDGRIIIAGSYWGGYPYDIERPESVGVILVGTPVADT